MWWLVLGLLILLAFYLYKLNVDYYILSLCYRIKTTNGRKLEDQICVIPGVTRFGNNFDLIKMTPETIFKFCRTNNLVSKGQSYILYFLHVPVYNITTAEDAEQIFQSSSVITKSILYENLRPFLGDGLLISTDHKWHSRRKILTPAFHFTVLQNFNEIFKEESLKLLERLQNIQGDQIDVADIISEFTLNNICETALGVKMDKITGSSEYRKIIHDIELIIVKRTCNPLMYYAAIFYLFGEYSKQKKSIQIAHDFSSKIITKKREEYQAKLQKSDYTEENEFGKKTRYAMLDTLLDEEAKGFIDHQGICDEVNTFMFEGYDTTSTCLIFTILNMALHKEIQDKCRQEVEELVDFSELTVFDFNKLEYLECVLKETLRLYPSVPFVARHCVAETRLNNLILPERSQINIHINDIMRDPKHFPEPNLFKPERFFPEVTVKRHPFAYVPFSAGSRNCIGQKFAILEMKAVMVAILKNFEILPITKLEDLTFENGLILRTQQKIYVKLKKIKQVKPLIST